MKRTRIRKKKWGRNRIEEKKRNVHSLSVISGSLSPGQVAFSGYGWRNGLQYRGLLRIYWISSRGQPKRGGPTAWGLGEVLTNAHPKNASCYDIFIQSASDLDWSAAHRELARYKLDLVVVQEVKWDKRGTERAGDYTFSMERETKIINLEQKFLYTTE